MGAVFIEGIVVNLYPWVIIFPSVISWQCPLLILCIFMNKSAQWAALVLSGPWLSWSYGSWICNYLCNQWLTLRVRIPLRRGVLDTTICDKVSQWLATGRWVFSGTPESSTNKSDHKKYNWNIVESDAKHHKFILWSPTKAINSFKREWLIDIKSDRSISYVFVLF